MAVRGQLSGCYLLSEEEYRDLSARVMVAEGPLREAQAEALHWRAEHDRVCQELDAANVRADGAHVEACVAWGKLHDAQTDIDALRMANAGLVGGQRSLMAARDEARAACERLSVDLSRARLATEQEEAKVTRVMAAAIERDKEVAYLRGQNAALDRQITEVQDNCVRLKADRMGMGEALERARAEHAAENAAVLRQRDEARRALDEARAEHAALASGDTFWAVREGQALCFRVGVVPHSATPLVMSVRVKYLATDAAQGEADTEAQGKPTPPPR